MSESMLQREFKDRDVQRMRNLITKDYTAKTTTQVGYTKAYIDHIEGDVWEENNRQWTIKNGIKMTISKLDALKKALSLPISCPNCRTAMKDNNANRKMWSIHKMCLNCVVKIETELKRRGQYEEYERNMNRQSINEYIKELEQLLLEISINDMNGEDFVTEEGDIEKWGGKVNKQKLIQDLQEYIQKIKDNI
jgi:hypothetical protein